jgi:CubicO group peptidase (beta-lactamase class C family)
MVASRAHLRTILEKAVQDGVIPGVAVVAGQAGLVSVREVLGWRQVSPSALPATTSTLWDLASLTKALVTSVLAMQAVESGAVSLDQPLGVAPDGADAATANDITVRRVLAHAGGFAAHLPLWEAAAKAEGAAARAAVVAAAGRAPLLYPPGTRSVYSDLGFILLGDLLERTMGDRLDRLAARLGAPFGSPTLGFRPSPWLSGQAAEVVAPGNAADIAATTLCPTRRRISLGEVDDRNAWAMGGVAGHAGLFGTLDAVAAITQSLLAAYRGAGATPGTRPLVDRDVVRLFFTPASIPGSTWRLGWEGPSAHDSLAGDLIARSAVGHLAFTGCSLWMDPEREAFVAMLSNRHHPQLSEDTRFRTLRRTVNDTALALAGY